ncbi:MAG: CPBP family intramembrane metalloprotease [Christensenellaceae bacterium]|jgi:membrane protease YdiL (CAAX protease family)|nr:CPBP family intramembrane metalloprotease [Christensenellaceae bacterium]
MNKKNNFLIACIVYMATVLLLIAIRFCSGMGWLSNIPDEPLEVGFSIISQVIIMFALPYFVYKIYDNKRKAKTEQETNEIIIEIKKTDAAFTDFGFRRISWRFILMAFALGFLLYIMNIFVGGVFYLILDDMGYRFSSNEQTFTGWGGLFISLLLVCVLPGFCEEFSHRGLLLSGFQSKFSNYRAVMSVCILFGLMHLNIEQVFYATILGWLICMAVLSSRSVWVGVIIHFTNNAISTYLSYADDLNLPGLGLIDALAGGGVLVVLLVLILVFTGIGAIMKVMAKENFEKNKKVYVAKYIALHSNDFSGVDFERVTSAVERAIDTLPTWKAVFAYCETNDKPQKLTPAERAVFTSLFVLGGLVTVFTFCWGML